MKFNTTTILGLAYIMMLMGAHVLAIREKVSFERTSHRHRTIRKGRKGRKAHSKTKGECPLLILNLTTLVSFFLR